MLKVLAMILMGVFIIFILFLGFLGVVLIFYLACLESGVLGIGFVVLGILIVGGGVWGICYLDKKWKEEDDE